MKYCKKFLLLMLCSAIIFQTAVFADEDDLTDVADDNSITQQLDLPDSRDTVSSPVENTVQTEETVTFSEGENLKVSLLLAIGVLDEADFDTEEKVTREQFAGMLGRLCREFMPPAGYSGCFSDVKENSDYAPYIEQLVRLGVVNGTGDGKFNPEREIKLRECIKMLCDTANYRAYADMSGGYPSAYFKIANNGKLFKGMGNIRAEDGVTGRDMAELLYNYLSFAVLEPVLGQVSYTKQKEKTPMLEYLLGIKTVSGVVVSNGITALYSLSSGKKVEIRQNGISTFVDAGGTLLAGEIGKYTDVYFKEKDDEKICVFFADIKEQNTLLDINLRDVEDISDAECKYYQDDKAKKIKYKGLPVILNGIYTSQPLSMKMLGQKNGSICFVDNNSDREYDAVIIKLYNSYTVGIVTEKGFYDKKDTALYIDCDENDYEMITYKFSDGAAAIKEDLSANDIVSVLKSDESVSSKIIELVISREKVSGIITDISTGDNDEKYVTFDNMGIYRLLFDRDKEAAKLGGAVGYLDAFGNIAHLEFTNMGDFRYGLMHKVLSDKKELQAEILYQTGEYKRFKMSEKVRVDGDTYKDIDLLEKYLSEGVEQVTVNGSSTSYKLPFGIYPVRYKLDGEGNIKELDTPMPGRSESKNSLTLIRSGYDMLTNDNVLGLDVPIDKTKTTRIKLISQSGAVSDIQKRSNYDDPSFISIGSASSMSAGYTFTEVSYKIDENSLYADLVLTFEGVSNSHDDMYTVISKIYPAYNQRTETVTTGVKGFCGGSEVNLIVADEYISDFNSKNIVEGEAMRFKINKNGEITGIENITVDYDLDAASVTIGDIGQGLTNLANLRKWSNKAATVHGYVTFREGNIVKIAHIGWNKTLTGRMTGEELEACETVTAKISDNIPVTVYDTSKSGKERLRSGSADDIVDYIRSGNGYSRVMLRYRSAKLVEAIVFNDASLFERQVP